MVKVVQRRLFRKGIVRRPLTPSALCQNQILKYKLRLIVNHDMTNAHLVKQLFKFEGLPAVANMVD